jgi:hypothetical protein
MISDVLDLDAAAVLAATESILVEQRQRAVEELLLVLQWADLHGDDPGEARALGSNQLVALGGEGTPLVQDLCWGELAIARQAAVFTTQRLAADALDLRHRLPRLWAAVCDLRVEAWVARKVARLSRALSKDAVQVVDVAVAAAADQAPGRIIAIAEAKVIEADPDAHRARLAEDAAKVGVRLSHPRPGQAVDAIDGEPATRRITVKVPHGIALDFDHTVEELADALHDHLTDDERETITRGDLQAKAIELLSNPDAAAAFLAATRSDDPTQEPPPVPKPRRKPAVLYAHISDLVLAAEAAGVVRVEGIGPMLVDQLAELLHHREISLQPVIDLRLNRAVNGYEHPTKVKERTLLRMLGDAFPHSANTGYRRLDHDHPTPYVPPDQGGPPGQTGDHNDAPVTRTHHRIKTHQPYDVRQLGLGTYRWTTPHGLGRLVTPTGTRPFEPVRDRHGHVIGEIYHPRNTDIRLEFPDSEEGPPLPAVGRDGAGDRSVGNEHE